MKRRIASLLVTLALAFAIYPAAPVAAVPVCNGGAYVQVYENTGLTGDNHVFCRSAGDVTFLSSWSAGLNPSCSRTPISYNNWDNCISSIRTGGSGWGDGDPVLCLFDNTNLGPNWGVFKVTTATTANFGTGAWNDRISSFRWWVDTFAPFDCPS